ncbi:ABC transporter permease, partial [Streptomyces sp. SID11233]|nr:ABC transporter permease [Streptomyces sp. SID11233]
MSTPTTTAPEKAQAAPPRPRPKLTWPVVLLLVAGLLIIVSAVRLITGADGITATGQMSAALRLAVPIGLAG